MGRIDTESNKQPKRLAILKESEQFQPAYKLEFALPEVPIKPKLFKYKFDSHKSYGYELSSVEINQGHLINVDFNLGIDLDLVDRAQHFLNAAKDKGEDFHFDLQTNPNAKELEDLRQAHFDEKDRFLLSNQNSLEAGEKRQKTKITSADIILPSRYERVDKVIKQGVDFKDPLAVRQLTEQEGEEIIMTHPDYYGQKEKALDQIEKRFAQIKNVKAGMKKEGAVGVEAEEVFDLVPFQQHFQSQHQVILCDDAIEEEFGQEDDFKKRLDNNSVLLHSSKEKALDHNFYGLYKMVGKQNIPRPLLESVLGKRPRLQDDLEKAVCLEYVRDYVLFHTSSEVGNEALIQMDSGKKLAKLLPIKDRANVQKKKKQVRKMQNQEEEEEVLQPNNASNPPYIVIAGRSYTSEELKKHNSVLEREDVNVRLGSALFEDKMMLKDEEKRAAPQLKALFEGVNKRRKRSEGEDEEEEEEKVGKRKLKRLEDEEESEEDLFGENDDY